MKKVSHLFILVAVFAALTAGTMWAADYYVRTDGNNDNDGTADDLAHAWLTIQYAINSVAPGNTINVAAGTYNENNIRVDKSLIIVGAGPGSTFVDPGGSGNIFYIDADGVTIKNLTIQNGSQGVRFEKAGEIIDNTEIKNVEFLDNSSRGIEIHNATTVTDLRVLDSFFDNNRIGIRWASSGVSEGVLIDNSTFQNHSSLGIYEANDGSVGYVRDLTITNSTFTNCGWAVYGEELRDVLVTGNTFQDQARGFYLWRAYNGAGVLAGDIIVSNNEFHDHTQVAIRITGEDREGYPNPTPTTSIDLPVMITGNTITADAELMADQWAQILIQLFPEADHAAVTVEDNTLTFSGTFATDNASHGITLQGDPDAVTIRDNTLDGGNVGDAGGTPPMSGLYIAVNAGGYWGSPTPSSSVTVNGNIITGFVNGISVYDESALAFGGLPLSNEIHVNFNEITGNTSYGIANGPGTIDGTCNWWGDVSGPWNPHDDDGLNQTNLGDGDWVTEWVLYDPWIGKGGFVTGGGTILSEAGYYRWVPDAAGQANFGFVSRYKKGVNVPEGHTNFVFDAGGLHFRSSEYDWLVVANNTARFKGVGTIDGYSGIYKFMIWASDDDPDSFRIKIWEEVNGEDVVYDNGSQQAITGGNIFIHKEKNK